MSEWNARLSKLSINDFISSINQLVYVWGLDHWLELTLFSIVGLNQRPLEYTYQCHIVIFTETLEHVLVLLKKKYQQRLSDKLKCIQTQYYESEIVIFIKFFNSLKQLESTIWVSHDICKPIAVFFAFENFDESCHIYAMNTYLESHCARNNTKDDYEGCIGN